MDLEDNQTACVRETKLRFEIDTVYQDINFIYTHFSILVEAIKCLETRGEPLHKSLEGVNRTKTSSSSAPGETGKQVRKKLDRVLSSNLGLQKIEVINRYMSGITESLPQESIELSVPLCKYCSITSVDIEMSFSAYKHINR